LSVKWKRASEPKPNLHRMQQRAFGYFQQGDLDRAERFCSEILGYRPDDFDALHLLGLVYSRWQRLPEAMHFFAAAIKTNPCSADALSNFGLVLHASGSYAEAISSYGHALNLAPGNSEILFNLGNACLELGRLTDALASYDAALAARPDHVGALVNRGNTLLRLNEPVAALASYDRALVTMPHHPQILTNRGHALRRLDRVDEALVVLKRAVDSGPEFAEAHFEAAMARLTLGDFDTGWAEYEWRWKTGVFARHRKPFRSGLWLGEQPVGGKTILLHAEQGFGDTIQFIRYAPLLAQQGARVVCEVQPELKSLLSQLEGVEVIAAGEPLPRFDLHCPLLSLPLAFQTRADTIPTAAPYLAASGERQHDWRGRLPTGRPLVGFVWSGSPSHKNDANRSIPLARLTGLFEGDCFHAVSLQREMRSADAEVMRDLPNLAHLGPDLRDFADAAAVIGSLDIVVSVDTAVAHLAGAMGKPVLVLLPYAADFRWMRGREDSPWYPTARLLRQTAFGDWDRAIHRLDEELRRLR